MIQKKLKIKEIVFSEYSHDEFRPKNVLLIEANKSGCMPLEDWYFEKSDEKMAQQKKDQEENERKEYQRLKAKFEN